MIEIVTDGSSSELSNYANIRPLIRPSESDVPTRVTDPPPRLKTESCGWPAELAISLLQGKWKLRILQHLRLGPARFNQLLRAFPGASKKVLTQQLREMEEDGIIARIDLSGSQRHVEYSLESLIGPTILDLIEALSHWGNFYDSSVRQKAKG